MIDAAWLAERIGDHTARGIAASMTNLIRSGDLPAGTRLPTVRGLAAELGVSPGTVADAWSTLRRHRVVSAQRRRGTVVIGPPNVPHPARYERIGEFGNRLAVDLAIAAPDPALLPPLDAALAAGARTARLNDYTRETITPALRAAAEPGWPFPPAAMLAVGGGYEGVQLVCQTVAVPGDRVAVEDPTGARLLDILEAQGAEVVPVACDDEGPEPGALAEALATGPAAFVYQPRAHTPRGHALTPARAAALAELLAPTNTLAIEDDGTGEVSSSPAVSVGAHLPERTVLVRSYSKSHGPDLRLAVIGGAAEPVERVRVLRSFGTGWTSRVLQDALAHLLTDPAAVAAVARARAAYTERREGLAAALAERGVRTGNRDGLMLWVPVADESAALVTLAAHGVAAVPGSRYQIVPADAHVRIATGRLPDAPLSMAELADLVALAARPH
ncbi:aminotransferase class I/II-fold pyridoxal phosphate-dependent enzyme [Actinomadura violacea]|uniref:Aminotransferase class I/II-fold pyridoxal phosphate-dependent enzyme n=1 Tax=Actinomadura violacea TaxID=2819934 RepID=A0ABS3S3W1_9ACTN|nr:aminotransferase class I/II-fold pyridoxal phosphate-dependent enzyme [Actinomadura violacea]MBO2463676.1 aminotransferase class I/II-fold pyridoxal phosphate-dependent enzyme [Actinomadura violacea]